METQNNVSSSASPSHVGGNIDGVPFVAMPKRFRTGSRGWFANFKAKVQGEYCQINLICTVVGSKQAPTTEQNGTIPETDPETPLFDEKPAQATKPAKTPRKRS